MSGVRIQVCSAFATGVRQTVFPHWTSDSHFPLAVNLVAKEQQFLGNCVGTLWLREESKEALVSILNHFGCPVPPLFLVDPFKFSRATKCSTLGKQLCITSCPLARTQRARPGTLLSRLSLHLHSPAATSFVGSVLTPVLGCRSQAFSLLLAHPGCSAGGRAVPRQQ